MKNGRFEETSLSKSTACSVSYHWKSPILAQLSILSIKELYNSTGNSPQQGMVVIIYGWQQIPVKKLLMQFINNVLFFCIMDILYQNWMKPVIHFPFSSFSEGASELVGSIDCLFPESSNPESPCFILWILKVWFSFSTVIIISIWSPF